MAHYLIILTDGKKEKTPRIIQQAKIKQLISLGGLR